MCVKLSFGGLNPGSCLFTLQKFCTYGMIITLRVCGGINKVDLKGKIYNCEMARVKKASVWEIVIE